MLKSTDLYIDLGTTNTLVYGRGKGLLINEPSVIALKQGPKHSKDILKIGADAKVMLGKNPETIFITEPLREGVIADFENTSKLLKSFVGKIKENVFWNRPRMIISLPFKVSEFEKNSVRELGFSLGAKIVHLLDEPMAAAVGCGLPVLKARGQMVVDMGGGTTEIAVISLGGIVASTAVRVGGNHMNSAIRHHIRKRYNFLIGEPTAELLKIQVGAASLDSVRSIEVGGFDLNSGLPKKITVDTGMIFAPINLILNEILDSIKEALEICPPEVSGDLTDTGIVLTGGGALLQGVASRLFEETGVPVRVSDHPLLSVAMGGAKILEDVTLFDGIERPA